MLATLLDWRDGGDARAAQSPLFAAIGAWKLAALAAVAFGRPSATADGLYDALVYLLLALLAAQLLTSLVAK